MWLCCSTHVPYKARSPIQTRDSRLLLESGRKRLRPSAGAPAYYVPVAHSDLTRDPTVAAAVVDLLRKGSTRRLPTKWATTSRAQASITDRQLRRTHTQKVDWAALEPDERRIFLQSLNEPPKLQLRIPSKKKSPARR